MPEAAGLYYEVHGAEDAPPLILSSGLGGSASYWAPNIPALAEHFRVIAYDHRGTGRSYRDLPETVVVDDFADDILALMDELGLARAHLIGHAAGGVAGLALKLKAPERLGALVVVNGWIRPDPHFERCFDARLALLRNSGVEAYLRAQPIFLYPATWISQHHADLEAELPHQISAFPGAATMEKRIDALRRFDISELIHELRGPMLAIAARDDMLVPYTCSEPGMIDVPGMGLDFMGWGGHSCNVTDPEGFAWRILEFLTHNPLEV